MRLLLDVGFNWVGDKHRIKIKLICALNAVCMMNLLSAFNRHGLSGDWEHVGYMQQIIPTYVCRQLCITFKIQVNQWFVRNWESGKQVFKTSLNTLCYATSAGHSAQCVS